MPNNIQAGSLNSTPFGSTWQGGFDDEPPLVFGSAAGSAAGPERDAESNEPEWQEEVGSNVLLASRGTLYALNGGQATALRTPPVEEVRTVHHVNGIIIFAVVDWENEYSFYASDGTAAGTKLLYGPIEGAFSSLDDMRVVDGEVHFVGEDDVRDEAFVGIIGEDGSFRAETASLDEVSREELLNYVRNLSDLRPTGALAPDEIAAVGPVHGLDHHAIDSDFHDADHAALPAIHDDALNTDPADVIGASSPAGDPKKVTETVAEAGDTATADGGDSGTSAEPGPAEAGGGGAVAELPAPVETASGSENGSSSETPASSGIPTVLPEIVSNTPILDDDDDDQFVFIPPAVVSAVVQVAPPAVEAIDLGAIGISLSEVIESASLIAASVAETPDVEDAIAGLGDLINPLLGDHLFS